MKSDETAASDSTRPSRGPGWLRAWSGPVLGGLALVVAITGLVSGQRTHHRLEQLEARLVQVSRVASTEPSTRRVTTERPGGRTTQRVRRRAEGKMARRKGAEAGPKERKSPAERQRQIREEVTATIEAFGMDRGMDDATVGRVLGELEARNDAVRAVFQDLAAGAVSAEQAREEVQWVRDESATSLRDLLGDDLYEALDRHLAERSPRRRRAAMTRTVSDEPVAP
ncbi:MAG: hypothetical protein AAGA48_11095 [Myxococcota bacterium]